MSHLNLADLDALGVVMQRMTVDSRKVQPGDIFLAYPGERSDGRKYIPQAIELGAAAILWEAKDFRWSEEQDIPNLGIENLRLHAGEIAHHIYGGPSEKLWMVGVTGTNGKTSCSHWVAKTLSGQGQRCAVIGTLGNGFPEALSETANTTPEALTVHGLLKEYLAQGAKAAVMEVSSHALAQGRVNAIHFDVALLTNLTHDHLDYHGDMERYAAAKRKLFEWESLKYAVVNLDDPFGMRLSEALLEKQSVEVIGYGMTAVALEHAERAGMRMVHGGIKRMQVDGMEIQINSSWGKAVLKSALIGRFNASNLLGTLAVLLVSRMNLEEAVQGLGARKAVAGRMQTLGGKDRPMVVVDYAHTPDALEKVLQTLREVTAKENGKLICVFGCGGDRDSGKRPMMGRVAEKFADGCVVTSDNPRNEEPQQIIAEIVAGMEKKPEVIDERGRAIALAIAIAQPGDTVLIAGKGHEDYQEIRGVRHPFSDIEAAKRALSVWAPEERSL